MVCPIFWKSGNSDEDPFKIFDVVCICHTQINTMDPLMYFTDFDYGFILFASMFALYSNSIDTGYVWDDRAAIVDNLDVHGTTPLSTLFTNDFWGQDMQLWDSHKSYRPFTVLTYRMNHTLGGLQPWGYHLGNVLIYSLCTVFMYMFASQWMSKRGARVAALIFGFHPVHVEAVASLVGRADALCGLLFLASSYLYTAHIRNQGSGYTARVLTLIGAIICGLASSLSKEVGVTIFGVLILLEFANQAWIFQLKCIDRRRSRKAPLRLTNDDCMNSFIAGLKETINDKGSIFRIILCIITLCTFMYVRLLLHGKHTMYKWTYAENHVHLMPSFSARAMSYGQSHFWYIAKLFYPRYLCFDYGLACLPTIVSFFDIRNIMPLFMYAAIGSLVVASLRRMRIVYLVGLAALLLPLFPALNILFPVGTLLAERLLFVPSVGFAMIVAEFLTVDILPMWTAIGTHLSGNRIGAKLGWFGNLLGNILGLERIEFASEELTSTTTSEEGSLIANTNTMSVSPPRSASNSPLKQGSAMKSPLTGSPMRFPLTSTSTTNSTPSNNRYQSSNNSNVTAAAEKRKVTSNGGRSLTGLFLLPLIVLYSARVITRNIHWSSETEIFERALDVCPLSIKANNNIGMFRLGRGDFNGAQDVLENALFVHNNQVSAHINVAISYCRSGGFLNGLAHFERARLLHSSGYAKINGYKGICLNEWSNHINEENVEHIGLLKAQAAAELDMAIASGWAPPAIGFQRAILALDTGDYETSLRLTLAAVETSAQAALTPHIPSQDMIGLHAGYNMLGVVYNHRKRDGDVELSEKYYLKALEVSPNNCDTANNLGMLYRQLGRLDDARKTLKLCDLSTMTMADSRGATLNNLGMLEMDSGNVATALEYFQASLASLKNGKADPNWGTIYRNFETAKQRLG